MAVALMASVALLGGSVPGQQCGPSTHLGSNPSGPSAPITWEPRERQCDPMQRDPDPNPSFLLFHVLFLGKGSPLQWDRALALGLQERPSISLVKNRNPGLPAPQAWGSQSKWNQAKQRSGRDRAGPWAQQTCVCWGLTARTRSGPQDPGRTSPEACGSFPEENLVETANSVGRPSCRSPVAPASWHSVHVTAVRC